MAAQATLVLALGFALGVGLSRAGDAPALPSQKAAVVLPLLRNFSPGALSEKNVREKIGKILGGDCSWSRTGPGGTVVDLFYGLDDGETIHVTFVQDRLMTINREASARVREVLYHHPAAS